MNTHLNLPKEHLYLQLQINPLTISEKELAQILQRTRLDPRLMEITTEYIRDFWWTLDPQLLNKHIKKTRDPFTLIVATNLIHDHCSASDENKKSFLQWKLTATRGIALPAPQLYYIAQYPVASKMTWQDLEETLDGFKRANTFSKDLPFNKSKPGILKGPQGPWSHHVDPIFLVKLSAIKKIKTAKNQKKLSNSQLEDLTGINRVFLSKILNNKVENVSAEYLQEKTKNL